MIQIISGGKGKGKTKILLDKVNTEIKQSKGNIVYLDKNTKHMYELSNKVRLINVTDYCIDSAPGFVGFISGIISQDHDLEKVFLDSFLSIACVENDDYFAAIKKLEIISSKFNVDFVISISRDKNELPEELQEKVIVSL